MDFKKFAIEFIIVFAITLLVCIGVTFFWSLVFHGVGIADWETSFALPRFSGSLYLLLTQEKE